MSNILKAIALLSISTVIVFTLTAVLAHIMPTPQEIEPMAKAIIRGLK